MYSSFARRATAGLVLVSVFSIPAPDLCGQSSMLERDVEFVRALAKNLGFIGLAQEETNRLQRVYQDSDQFPHVAQLGVEISLVGAKLFANRERQRTLFRDAIDRCKELLEAHPEGTVAQAARLTLGDACYEYGRFLVDELDLAREQSPELVPSLELEAAEIFRAGVDACEIAMRELRPEIDTNADKRLLYGVTWLRKGVLLREHGRAVRRDRTALCAFAKNTLEELIFEWGEETALGLRGLFDYAQCDEVLGNPDDAADLYTDTIEQLITSLDQSDELGLTAQSEAFLFEMMQEIYDRMATLLFESGQTEEVLATAEEFRTRLREIGDAGADVFETAHERYGHSLFLTEARAQAESGQPDQVSAALAMVKRINEQHPNDIVGLKAKAVLKGILAAQTRMVSGALLFEVAKGEFQNENHEEAIRGLKRALGSMTDAERNEHGLESYFLIGRSYRLQERYLEAVLAMQKGLQNHGTGGGAMAQDLADRLDRTMRTLRRVTKNDTNFDDLNNQVLSVVAAMGGVASANQMHWNRGGQHQSEGNFTSAAQSYASITDEFLRYDLAQSRLAIAQRSNRDYADARRTIREFRNYTLATAVPDNRPDLTNVRNQALAEMAYAEAFMAYNEATGSEAAGTKKDLTRYPAVIELFQTFIADNARSGSNFLPRSYDILGRLHAEIGEMALAEEAYRNLRQVDTGKTLLSTLSTVIFSAYRTQIENLMKEGTDPDTLVELRLVRSKALALGKEYASTAPAPSYGMLYNSVREAEALEQWTDVDDLARQTIDRYGSNPEYSSRVDRFIRPSVGMAALQQRRFQQAYDMLSAAAVASPNNYPVKRLIALSLGGWLDFDDLSNPDEVFGLERPDEAYEVYWGDYRSYGVNPQRARKYELAWYEFHWECYWFARNAAQKDSVYADRANPLYNIAKSTDNFDTLLSLDTVLWQKFTRYPPRNLPRPTPEENR